MSESLQPFAAWLVQHTYIVVFAGALVDATGIPFPGRLLLVAAGAFAARGDVSLPLVIVLGAAGAAATDHLWYFSSALGADRPLKALCRVALGAQRCARATTDWFERYGALTIVLGRFVAGVRLLAWPLARKHGISYPMFVLMDALGALLWSAVWVGLGWLLGEHALDAAGEAGWVGLGLAALAVLGFFSLRLWRRRSAAAS